MDTKNNIIFSLTAFFKQNQLIITIISNNSIQISSINYFIFINQERIALKMNTLLTALLMLLLSATVQSAIMPLTPVYLSIPLPLEHYFEYTSFVSTPDNVWRNFGTLNQTIALPIDQYVEISYGVSGEIISGPGHIVTRVLVDGVEKRQFRSISGNTVYVHTSIFNRILLTAGNHSITLQYRTPFSIDVSGNSDWRGGYLKLTY